MKTPPLIYTLAVLALAGCSRTPEPITQTPVHWTVAPVSGAFGNGAVNNVRIDATIDNGWHVYSTTQPAGGPYATRVSVPEGQPFVIAGSPDALTPPHVAFDEAFKMDVQLHEKAASFDVPVRLATATTEPGDSVHVNVRYQACNASLCLPPQTAKLVAPVLATAQ